MKPSAELFELIKSLSRNEKRYFKLHASMQKGSKNYLKLFKAIDSLKVYDELLLKSEYRKENFVKNFTFNKNYLTRLIFKTLNSYSDEDSIESKLGNIMKRCKIFLDKALIRQYFRTVQQGKKLAEENEMFGYLIEFIEMERQLTPKEQISKKNIHEVYDKKEEVINKILNINLYQRAVSDLFAIQRREGIIRSSSSEKEVDKILKQINIRKSRKPESVTAKERFYFAHFLGSMIKGKFQEAYNFNKKRFALISGNSGIFQKFIYDNNRESMLSLIESASAAGKHTLAKNLFKIYKSKFNKKDRFELRSEIICHCIQLAEALHSGKTLDNNFLLSLEKVLLKYKGKININLYNLLYYNLSQYYFINDQYLESLRMINILFENRYLKHTPNLEPYTRILNLLIHYELKNYKLLSHLIPATVKYLKGKNRLFKTEKIILHFLKKSITGSGRTKDKLSFTRPEMQIRSLKNDKYEKNAILYFAFLK